MICQKHLEEWLEDHPWPGPCEEKDMIYVPVYYTSLFDYKWAKYWLNPGLDNSHMLSRDWSLGPQKKEMNAR